MSTAIDVITRALYSIGAHSDLNPASPEMLSESFDFLQDLLRDWTADDIDIGATVPSVQTDDLGEDAGSRHALILCLGERLAPIARVTLRPEYMAMTGLAFEELRRKFETVTITDKSIKTSTADGQGNMRGDLQ